jgi:predicted  nucleic acid-binding Zn-ribbon protein
MNDVLEKLVRLHHAESEIKQLEAELAAVPKARQEVEARLLAERSRLDAARAALDASGKARKAHEAAVQDLETKRSKYKGQLMDVKTNKEYTAMLHEIEGVERDIRSREDLILEEMEKAEGLARAVRDEEADFKVVEQEARSERAALDGRETSLTTAAARLRAERDALLATISEEPRGLYLRVARLRGTAVAEARDGTCQTCRMKLRLQVWADLRTATDTMFQCESCGRILYYEPPPPTVVVEP